jgi:hypothetical protein
MDALAHNEILLEVATHVGALSDKNKSSALRDDAKREGYAIACVHVLEYLSKRARESMANDARLSGWVN